MPSSGGVVKAMSLEMSPTVALVVELAELLLKSPDMLGWRLLWEMLAVLVCSLHSSLEPEAASPGARVIYHGKLLEAARLRHKRLAYKHKSSTCHNSAQSIEEEGFCAYHTIYRIYERSWCEWALHRRLKNCHDLFEQI